LATGLKVLTNRAGHACAGDGYGLAVSFGHLQGVGKRKSNSTDLLGTSRRREAQRRASERPGQEPSTA
jgi:hypothetical protein